MLIYFIIAPKQPSRYLDSLKKCCVRISTRFNVVNYIPHQESTTLHFIANPLNSSKTILLTNTISSLTILGQYRIEDLDKVMCDLHRHFGKIAKVGGLIGHPDLLFVFDADLIRDTFKKEEVQPHRPAMPSLRNYKSKLRKDFFGDNMGLIGV